jgi:subtilisin family serine protease
MLILLFTSCSSGSSSDNEELSMSDELFYKQWYINYNSSIYSTYGIDDSAHINVKNYLNTYTGSGIKIAIIDNGFDLNHIELKDSVLTTYDEESQSNDVSHKAFENYHGTAVAGLIAAKNNEVGILGLARNSDIIYLKYARDGTSAGTIDLFQKAEEFGADIVCNSWGTGLVSTSVKDEIIRLSNTGRNGKGMIIVFASGNGNKDIGEDESSIPEVITVGSSNKFNVLSTYSNYGSSMDIVAPGGNYIGLVTTDPIGAAGGSLGNYLDGLNTDSFVGTSAAAPLVCGAIAMMLEKDPSLSRIEIDTILQNTSDKIGNIPYLNGRNDSYGYGKLNMKKIFEYMDN